MVLHRLDEVTALADDADGAYDVVARAASHGDAVAGLGLAMDGRRTEGLLLVVNLGCAIEDVVGEKVDECDAVLGAGTDEKRGAP